MAPSEWIKATERSGLVREALALARRAHAGRHRDIGDAVPFVEHPLAVAELLAEQRLDEETVAAGLLHDTLERTDVTLEELRKRCGERVAAIVAALSEDMSIEDYRERRQGTRERVVAAGLEAQRVFAAEQIDNMVALRDAWDACTVRGVDIEDEMEISLGAQMGLWEDDLEMFFSLDDEREPLFKRFCTELEGLGDRPVRTEQVNEVVARAGAVMLLELSSLEKRAALSEALTEATAWQDLSEHQVEPTEPRVAEEGEADEEDFDDFDDDLTLDAEIGANGEEEDLEDEDEEDPDHDFALDSENGDEEDRYTTTDQGREMVTVYRTLYRWLGNRLERPIDLRRRDAQRVLHALAWGWSSTVVHALASGPLTLSELRRAVGGLPVGTVRRYVEEMEESHLVESREDGGETRYEVTDWLREAVGVLSAAAWLELRHPGRGIASPDELDVGAAAFLALPLLELPAGISGSCRLGFELGGDREPWPVGVTVRVERGRVLAVDPGLDERADAWAAASTIGWIDTLLDPTRGRVKTGGEEALPRALLTSLHERLFVGGFEA